MHSKVLNSSKKSSMEILYKVRSKATHKVVFFFALERVGTGMERASKTRKPLIHKVWNG